jgi:hypothetical protein
MNKLLKNSSLALILLATTFQTIPTPFDWHIIISWFSWNQQPQENPDQAPAGVTIDNYVAQFYSDMNGRSCIIPLDEMQEMEIAIRKELLIRNIDLRNEDLVNQEIRSVLCGQLKTGIRRDMRALAREKNYRFTQEEFETIPNSYENNLIARLGRMPHLNGEAIAEYYGIARKNSLERDYINRKW